MNEVLQLSGGCILTQMTRILFAIAALAGAEIA